MPTISKEKIPFISSTGETLFVRELKVTSFGSFSIDLPPDVVLALDKKTVYDVTSNACIEKFNEALAEYRTKKATKKKIIAYKLSLDGDIERDGKPALDRWADYFDQYSKVEGLGLSIRVGVFHEIKVEAPGYKSKRLTEEWRYEVIPSTLPKSVRLVDLENQQRGGRFWTTQMDWTEAREAFWLRVSVGLEHLILDLAAHFADSKKTLKLADGKTPFLALK